MMSLEIRLLVILVGFALLISTIELVREGRLRERYSLIFLLVAAMILCLGIFAGTLQTIASRFGISYGPSLAFGVVTFLILLALVSQGAIISSLSMHTQDLAQKVAELEWELREVRGRMAGRQTSVDLAWPDEMRQALAQIRERKLAEHEREL